MRDRIFIFAGLLVFLILFAYPVWSGLVSGASTVGPTLQLPVGAKACVASRDFMRSSHMQMLVAWRTAFVRTQQRSYAAADGAVYNISLSKTCLGQCHGSKAEFCDRCHSYVALTTPNCWDCHQDASAKRTIAAVAAPERRRP